MRVLQATWCSTDGLEQRLLEALGWSPQLSYIPCLHMQLRGLLTKYFHLLFIVPSVEIDKK